MLDVPPCPTTTESLLSRLGPIRNTHYGGFYDFTADLTLKDTAYTSQALAPHTDTTYFTDPIGLQALHILHHTADDSSSETTTSPSPSPSPGSGSGLGGHTHLIDGFRLARQLSPDHHHTLSTVPLRAHSSGNPHVSLQGSAFRVLQHDAAGRLERIQWNNDDRARFGRGVLLQGALAVEKWYEAAAAWESVVQTRDPRWWIELALRPGVLLGESCVCSFVR